MIPSVFFEIKDETGPLIDKLNEGQTEFVLETIDKYCKDPSVPDDKAYIKFSKDGTKISFGKDKDSLTDFKFNNGKNISDSGNIICLNLSKTSFSVTLQNDNRLYWYGQYCIDYNDTDEKEKKISDLMEFYSEEIKNEDSFMEGRKILDTLNVNDIPDISVPMLVSFGFQAIDAYRVFQFLRKENYN